MSPTAAEVLAALAALPSTVAGGTYATDSGGRSDINIMKTSTGAYWWKADMDIDTDGQPFPEQDHNSDRQTDTSFHQSDGKPLNSGTLPFIVIPLPSTRFRYPDHGIKGGDSCIVILNGRMVYAVFGDEGPTSIIGEASYAAAKALGVPGIPNSGWDGRDVTYIVFPGSTVRPIESVADRLAKGEANAAALIAAAGGATTPPAGPGEEEPVAVSQAAQKFIAEAIKTLGMSDENNTVQTPIHKWYNAKFGNPDPSKYAWDWCDGAVTYWAWQSGNQAAVVFGGSYAYTVDHANAFKSRGQWHTDVAGIQAGDVVFFDWDGSNSISAIDHVGIVEYVNGAEVHTIEGNIENAVQRKVRTAATIVGYGRPAFAADPSTPPPPTTPPPVPAVQVKLADAQAHKAAATKVIQGALNRKFGGVVVDGVYGPQTKAAYTRWQQFLGWPGDGEPGTHSLWALGKAYGFTTDITGTPAGPGTPTPPPVVTPPPVATPPVTPPVTEDPDVSAYLTVPEPAHNYSRVTYGGKTVNVRTREMLKLAAKWAGVTITLTQGSYNTGVAASAGTHDGGGVVDINVNSWSSSTRAAVQLALRKAGFAAWLRTPDDGFAYHIHACAIGDREMASLAKSQVQSYFNGRNGLANNNSDSSEHRWPNWADKYNQ